MESKTPTPRQRNTTRPDLAAMPNKPNANELEVETTLDRQGHTTETSRPEDGDSDGVIATDQGGTERPEDADDSLETAGETVPEKEPTVNFTGPFTTNGTTVMDSEGRTVAMVTGAHLSPEARGNAANWITNKLNAK